MEDNWKSIYSTSKVYLAEMVKNLLEENDIDAILLNKQDSLYLFGDVEVYVKGENVIKAKFLIKDL